MKKGKLWQNIEKHSDWWGCGIVVVLAGILFLFLQATPVFADPDSFYHAKMALLMKDHGIIKDFPWLARFTVLGKEYIDQHFLYHALLIPFVAVFGAFIGTKAATVLFATALVGIFCGTLQLLRVRGAAWYGLILLATTPFTFRMSLAKAPSLSVIFLLIGILFLWKKKSLALFFLSFLYVWAYGGFALMMVITGIFCFWKMVWRIARSWHRPSHISLKKIWALPEVKLGFAVATGLIAGVVVNPYFPQNLAFYKSQLVDIGIVNYQNVIGVGGEWYPYGFPELISGTAFLTLLVIAALILGVIFVRRQTPESVSSFFYFAFFLLLTLKSKRYVEYYVPMATLFGAVTLHTSLREIDWHNFRKKSWNFASHHIVTTSFLILYCIVMVPLIVVQDLKTSHRDLADGSRYDTFATSMSWLKDNSNERDLVFHSDWDEFPILFYHNEKNDYIAGLDPTFMYKFNQDRYWEWVHITKGETDEALYDIIHNRFGARFVFLEKDHTGMDKNIAKEKKFTLVYEDREAKIYEVGAQNINDIK